MSNKIGVLVSVGYGAGWSTWGDQKSCLDQELVSAIDIGATQEEILRIAKKNWPEQYTGGLYKCRVLWLEKGQQFRITEYDGNESIEFPDDEGYWLVAE